MLCKFNITQTYQQVMPYKFKMIYDISYQAIYIHQGNGYYIKMQELVVMHGSGYAISVARNCNKMLWMCFD